MRGWYFFRKAYADPVCTLNFGLGGEGDTVRSDPIRGMVLFFAKHGPQDKHVFFTPCGPLSRRWALLPGSRHLCTLSYLGHALRVMPSRICCPSYVSPSYALQNTAFGMKTATDAQMCTFPPHGLHSGRGEQNMKAGYPLSLCSLMAPSHGSIQLQFRH